MTIYREYSCFSIQICFSKSFIAMNINQKNQIFWWQKQWTKTENKIPLFCFHFVIKCQIFNSIVIFIELLRNTLEVNFLSNLKIKILWFCSYEPKLIDIWTELLQSNPHLILFWVSFRSFSYRLINLFIFLFRNS
jgi:hypothetical protein